MQQILCLQKCITRSIILWNLNRKRFIMAITKYTLEPDAKLTKAQIKEIKEASKKPVVYDEDSPKLTDEQLSEFAKIAKQQREERKKKVIALRVNTSTLEKAKKLGKGYTAILSRMIDLCIDDKELLKKCL